MIYIPKTTASGFEYQAEPSAYWGIDLYLGSAVADGVFEALKDGLNAQNDGDTFRVAVIFDGNRYVTQAQYIKIIDTQAFLIGNKSIYERIVSPNSTAEDTGEPFVLMVSRSSLGFSAATTESGESHTFSVMDLDEIVEPEEPDTELISYIGFIANPKYRFLPFDGLFGWQYVNRKT